eukprot:355237-Chlamydomonas_euryale.AAC.5
MQYNVRVRIFNTPVLCGASHHHTNANERTSSLPRQMVHKCLASRLLHHLPLIGGVGTTATQHVCALPFPGTREASGGYHLTIVISAPLLRCRHMAVGGLRATCWQCLQSEARCAASRAKCPENAKAP